MPLVVLAAALALGGAIGAVSQFVLPKELWVWEMPDLAHRFLAIVAGLLGALVFVAPRDVGDLWPWGALDPWKTLDHRLVASMLCSRSPAAPASPCAAATRMRRRCCSRWVVAYCAVAVAGLALHAADTPRLAGEDTVYIVVLAIVGLLAAAMLARGVSARASAPAAPAPPPSPAAR